MPKSLSIARPVPDFEEDVLRLDVAMHDALGVRERQRLRDVPEHASRRAPDRTARRRCTACLSVRPGTSCMTSASPPSRRRLTACTVTMLGCCRRATVRASRASRASASSADAANSGRTTLIATSRNSASVARAIHHSAAAAPELAQQRVFVFEVADLTFVPLFDHPSRPCLSAPDIGPGRRVMTQRLLKVKSTSPISIRSPSSTAAVPRPFARTRPLCTTGLVFERFSRCQCPSSRRMRACDRLTV